MSYGSSNVVPVKETPAHWRVMSGRECTGQQIRVEPRAGILTLARLDTLLTKRRNTSSAENNIRIRTYLKLHKSVSTTYWRCAQPSMQYNVVTDTISTKKILIKKTLIHSMLLFFLFASGSVISPKIIRLRNTVYIHFFISASLSFSQEMSLID